MVPGSRCRSSGNVVHAAATRVVARRRAASYAIHRRVRVPAFITASWYDVILGHDLEHYARMQRVRGNARGTRAHAAADRAVVARHVPERRRPARLRPARDGRLARPRCRSRHAAGRWFKAQLGGSPAAALDGPRVKLFVQGVNRWRDEDDWPLARATPTDWYLRSDGRLTPEPPRADEGVDTFVFDPNDPCPTLGGDLVEAADVPAGPARPGADPGPARRARVHVRRRSTTTVR